jgi:prepilin signal peptidase PulO-like enzyme (type II secretory pathway)
LALLLGAGLGRSVIAAVVIGYVALFPIGIGILIRGGAAARKATVPFGPFLAFGALAVLIIPHMLGLGSH